MSTEDRAIGRRKWQCSYRWEDLRAYRTCNSRSLNRPKCFSTRWCTTSASFPLTSWKHSSAGCVQPSRNLRCRMVFIPTQIVNFGFVPHHMRVLVVGVVSLFWSTFPSPCFCAEVLVVLMVIPSDTYLSLANSSSQNEEGDASSVIQAGLPPAHDKTLLANGGE